MCRNYQCKNGATENFYSSKAFSSQCSFCRWPSLTMRDRPLMVSSNLVQTSFSEKERHHSRACCGSEHHSSLRSERHETRGPIIPGNKGSLIILVMPMTTSCCKDSSKNASSTQESACMTLHQNKWNKEHLLRTILFKTQIPSQDLLHLGNLLFSLKDVISQGDFDIGRTEVLEHRIEICTSQPLKESPRRLLPHLTSCNTA